MVSVDFHAAWKHVYILDNSGFFGIAFHKTLKQNQNNFISISIPTVLSFCADTEPEDQPNTVTANHFSAFIIPPIYHLTLQICIDVLPRGNKIFQKANTTSRFPGLKLLGLYQKAGLGELTCKDIHILPREQIWNAPESANKV